MKLFNLSVSSVLWIWLLSTVVGGCATGETIVFSSDDQVSEDPALAGQTGDGRSSSTKSSKDQDKNKRDGGAGKQVATAIDSGHEGYDPETINGSKRDSGQRRDVATKRDAGSKLDGKHYVPDQRVVVNESCDNSVDDDGDGLIDCADLVDCGTKAPCLDSTRTFVIHEVSCGNIDYISLRNVSAVEQNLDGYIIEIFGTDDLSYKLPAKKIGPGQMVRIVEFQVGRPEDVATNGNIPFYNGINANAVLLSAPDSRVIDYVGFGTFLAGVANYGINQIGGPVSYLNFNPLIQSHYRSHILGKQPTYQATDWTLGPSSLY